MKKTSIIVLLGLSILAKGEVFDTGIIKIKLRMGNA